VPNIERHQANTQAPVGPVVWILSHGEHHEGGQIDGVYTDRDLARGDFATKATEMSRAFGIDDARQNPDGSVHLDMGCDWLALEPHPLITRNQVGKA
jgi:hypothetical protein